MTRIARVTHGVAASVPRIGLFRRQSGTISIPTACESTCSNFISVWNACNENESTSACSEVCTTNYEQCLSCIADDTPNIPQSELSTLQQDCDDIVQYCGSTG
jgi:hypothetical protein